jgi:protein TonB
MKDFFRQSKQQRVMMEEERLNKKNRTVAAVTTAGLQAVFLLAMFMLVAWTPPDPPWEEAGGMGVELNFGMDDEGYGEIQPKEPVGNRGDQAEAPRQQEEAAVTPEAKEPEPEVKQPAKVPEIVETKPEVAEHNDDPESPVLVKEKKPEEKRPPVKPAEKAPEKPVEKVVEKKVEEKKPEVPTVDKGAVFKPREQTVSGTGTSGEKAGVPGNHGDDKGKVGDKGSPEGSVDKNALYGNAGKGGNGPGGSGGGGVAISGFNGFEWPTVQTPTLPEDAYGVYEFMVKVDNQGDVISVTPLQRGLSLEAERKLRAMIEKLTFVPKGANIPAQSEGKITFRVVSK